MKTRQVCFRTTIVFTLLLHFICVYATDIDTIGVINSYESDTLTEIEAEYLIQFLDYSEDEFTMPNIDSISGWHGIAYDPLYSHSVIAFMDTSVYHNDSSVLIIVESSVYNSMQSYILRYATDIYYGTDYDVYIESVNNASHVQIKELILSYQNKLIGVVLIGDIAHASYEKRYKNKADVWPCDLYYMDLNGIWEDNTDTLNTNLPNGVYDTHYGDVKPEIFVARISTFGVATSYIAKYDGLKRYFNKNHNYWSGLISATNQKALTYIEKDWKWSFDKMYGIKHLFGYDNYNMRRYGDDNFGKSQYIQMIQSNQYDLIQLCAHSNYNLHRFTNNSFPNNKEYFMFDELFSLQTAPIGFNLFCCKACNWGRSHRAGAIDSRRFSYK